MVAGGIGEERERYRFCGGRREIAEAAGGKYFGRMEGWARTAEGFNVSGVMGHNGESWRTYAAGLVGERAFVSTL